MENIKEDKVNVTVDENNAYYADDMMYNGDVSPVFEEENKDYDTNEHFDIYDELMSDNKNKEEEINSLKSKYTYLLADFDNYKRNSQKERLNTIKYGSEKVIKDILPIIDDFERCISSINDIETKEGVTLIYNKFINTLKKNDVTFVYPDKGEVFDDKLYEAVNVIPTDDEELKNIIVDCIESGVKLNDKVIRYAKVIVYC